MSAAKPRAKFEETDNQAVEELALASLQTDDRIIICGSLDEQVIMTETLAEEERSAEEIIDLSMGIDAEQWLSKTKSEIVAEYADDDRDLPVGNLDEAEPEASEGLVLLTDVLSGERHEYTLIARVPVKQSWHIPANMAIGGWNECPDPEVQCALWRRWQEKYDAHIVAVSHDVVEAYVGSPPKTPEAAMELAWEQFSYCRDIVEQGCETVADLAASLQDAQTWYFWWG